MEGFIVFKNDCPLRRRMSDGREFCGLSRVQEFFTLECNMTNCIGFYSYKMAYKEFKQKIEDRWEAMDDPGHS